MDLRLVLKFVTIRVHYLSPLTRFMLPYKINLVFKILGEKSQKGLKKIAQYKRIYPVILKLKISACVSIDIVLWTLILCQSKWNSVWVWIKDNENAYRIEKK